MSQTEREQRFLSLVQQFPDAAMGHFSLGKLYLEMQRFVEADAALERAVQLDATYAAAWVAIGDVAMGRKSPEDAIAYYRRALETPLGKKDVNLQSDVEQRIRDIKEFL